MITTIYPYRTPRAAKEIEHARGECPYCKAAAELSGGYPDTVGILFLRSVDDYRRVTIVNQSGDLQIVCDSVAPSAIIREIRHPSREVIAPDMSAPHYGKPSAEKDPVAGRLEGVLESLRLAVARGFLAGSNRKEADPLVPVKGYSGELPSNEATFIQTHATERFLLRSFGQIVDGAFSRGDDPDLVAEEGFSLGVRYVQSRETIEGIISFSQWWLLPPLS